MSRFFAAHGRLLRALAVVPILVLGMLAVPFLQQVANAATVSDNFNRANGGLGSNWTTVAGTTAPKIANNTLQPGTAGALNSAYWSASTFSGDQFAQTNLPNSSGGKYGHGIAVRSARCPYPGIISLQSVALMTIKAFWIDRLNRDILATCRPILARGKRSSPVAFR